MEYSGKSLYTYIYIHAYILFVGSCGAGGLALVMLGHTSSGRDSYGLDRHRAEQQTEQNIHTGRQVDTDTDRHRETE